MKKIMVVALLLAGVAVAQAAKSAKGETAHPVYKNLYTYE
jgi:hypothetical protein